MVPAEYSRDLAAVRCGAEAREAARLGERAEGLLVGVLAVVVAGARKHGVQSERRDGEELRPPHQHRRQSARLAVVAENRCERRDEV